MPFGCIRAISDAMHTRLSGRLVELLAGGRVSALRLFGSLIVSPGIIKELFHLAQHTRLAASRLAQALESLLATRP
jgi:hypothetical protein